MALTPAPPDPTDHFVVVDSWNPTTVLLHGDDGRTVLALDADAEASLLAFLSRRAVSQA